MHCSICGLVFAAVLQSVREFEIKDTLSNYFQLNWGAEAREWIRRACTIFVANPNSPPIEAPIVLGKNKHHLDRSDTNPPMVLHIAPGVRTRNYVASHFMAADVAVTVAPIIPMPENHNPQMVSQPQSLSSIPSNTHVLAVVMHTNNKTGLFDWQDEPRPDWIKHMPCASLEREISVASLLGWLIGEEAGTFIVLVSCGLCRKEKDELKAFCKRTCSTLIMPSKATVAYAANDHDPTLAEFGKLAVHLSRLSMQSITKKDSIQHDDLLRVAAADMTCSAIVIGINGEECIMKPISTMTKGVVDSPCIDREATDVEAVKDGTLTVINRAATVESVSSISFAANTIHSPSVSSDFGIAAAAATLLHLAPTIPSAAATPLPVLQAIAIALPPITYGKMPIGRLYSHHSLHFNHISPAQQGATRKLMRLDLKPGSAFLLLPPPDGMTLPNGESVVFLTAKFADTSQSTALHIIAFTCEGMNDANTKAYRDRTKNLARDMRRPPLFAQPCTISSKDAAYIANHISSQFAPTLCPANRNVFLLHALHNAI